MQRNISSLSQETYDLVIVGGGINGVVCAWEASLRGLRVALLEREDFGWATSSNSAKIAHSGLRYLQHADFSRMRESIRERNILVRNAPHLVEQQPFLLPVYGHGLKGREIIAIYMKLYDFFSQDRKWFKDEARRVPGSYALSTEEVVKMVPGIKRQNLSGGLVWCEHQMHNTERLLMSYVRSAADRGATFANYVTVKKVFQDHGAIAGVEAQDDLSGKRFSVRAKTVLNATGPWMQKTLGLAGTRVKNHGIYGSKAFSLITSKVIVNENVAVSFSIKPMYRDKKALVDKGSSIQFAIPWRGHTMFASLHLPCDDDPYKVTISSDEVDGYIEAINEGYPAAKLTHEDVRNVLWGIVPAEESGSAAPLKHYRIIDHGKEDGFHGLLSVVGVKYTTARDVAKKVIDKVYRLLGKTVPKSTSHRTPLWGGDIEFLHQFRDQAIVQDGGNVDADVLKRLIRNYGTQYRRILAYADDEIDLNQRIPYSDILKAEIVHSVREESAVKLADVVLRRTDLGSLQYPGREAISVCADILSRELGWDAQQRAEEISALRKAYLWMPTDCER